MESYSDIVLDHARNPRNQGVLENADAKGAQTNPVCGDTFILTLQIEEDRISDVRFLTQGCTASVATSSIITEMIKGLSLAEALDITHNDVSDAMGGLPTSKLHSAALVIDGLRRAITGYREAGS